MYLRKLSIMKSIQTAFSIIVDTQSKSCGFIRKFVYSYKNPCVGPVGRGLRRFFFSGTKTFKNTIMRIYAEIGTFIWFSKKTDQMSPPPPNSIANSSDKYNMFLGGLGGS